MSTVFKKIVVPLAALAALAGLAACGETTNWSEEVTKAGFTDPVVTHEGTRRVVMLATAGTCRLRFIADVEASRLYVSVPGPVGQDETFVGDPSLALLQRDERFATCFSSEKK